MCRPATSRLPEECFSQMAADSTSVGSRPTTIVFLLLVFSIGEREWARDAVVVARDRGKPAPGCRLTGSAPPAGGTKAGIALQTIHRTKRNFTYVKGSVRAGCPDFGPRTSTDRERGSLPRAGNRRLRPDREPGRYAALYPDPPPRLPERAAPGLRRVRCRVPAPAYIALRAT